MTEDTAAAAAVEQDETTTTSLAEDSDNDNSESAISSSNSIYTRPIVVGYAFGPKKMSTMGVVMAEASKTKLNTALMTSNMNALTTKATTTAPATASLDANSSIMMEYEEDQDNHDVEEQDRKAMPSPSELGLTRATLSTHDSRSLDTTTTTTTAAAAADPSREQQQQQQQRLDETVAKQQSSYRRCSNNNASSSPENIIFTLDGYNKGDGLENIVRYFRSSCSSMADSASTGTCTASTSTLTTTTVTTTPTATTLSSTTSSSNKKSSSSNNSQVLPLRVSFVPLDPDQPLEDQHGGKMDVILHKLTEDILCLSQLAMEHEELKHLSPETMHHKLNDMVAITKSEQAAIRRVYRLIEFQQQQRCCLVDDPVCVQTLMSRADIADTLKQCLRSVISASGIAVSSPKCVVVSSRHKEQEESNTSFVSRITCQMKQAGLAFPIIVKPLIAAGTKASHAMAVVLDETGLAKVVDKTPSLLQEFVNHDSLLYKVYVLGDHVSVHKRRSLPNLPKNAKSSKSYVEFDSQRPYPRLKDFGFDEKDGGSNNDSKATSGLKRPRATEQAGSQPLPKLLVTENEVHPIVDALKKAFGLELFGFDVLMTTTTTTTMASSNNSGSGNQRQRQMSVVDVNYFPSYKEVPNFPGLLAKYLTDRAIGSRRRKSTATKQQQQQQQQAR